MSKCIKGHSEIKTHLLNYNKLGYMRVVARFFLRPVNSHNIQYYSCKSNSKGFACFTVIQNTKPSWSNTECGLTNLQWFSLFASVSLTEQVSTRQWWGKSLGVEQGEENPSAFLQHLWLMQRMQSSKAKCTCQGRSGVRSAGKSQLVPVQTAVQVPCHYISPIFQTRSHH